MPKTLSPDPTAAEGDDSLEEFTSDLCALRKDAGDLTLAAIERKSGVSKTVLSDAFNGKSLPTARTIEGITYALGANAEEWLERRRTLEAALRPERPATPTPSATHSMLRTRTAVLLAAGCAALTFALTLGGAWLAWGPTEPTAGEASAAGGTTTAGTVQAEASGADSSRAAGATDKVRAADTPGTTEDAPRFVVENGVDPATTPCVDDAAVVSSETRERNTQLQIIYSANCHAAWSRITRFDDQATGNVVSTSIFRQIAPEASDRQDTTEPDAQSAYTTLIVRPTPQTRICATGSLTVGGKDINLNPPVCF